MIASLDQLVETARNRSAPRLVVAGADDRATLEGVVQARRCGVVDAAILVGVAEEIRSLLEVICGSSHDYGLIDAHGGKPIASNAVDIVARGDGDLLLKGRISTADLLSEVIAKGSALPIRRRLSDVLVTENPLAEGPPLIGVADGGINIAPDLHAKKEIIENGVALFQRLGVEKPRVALLCAAEKVSDAMPHTVDARKLAQMNRDGEITGCVVDGPLALDNALSTAAARAKGIDSPVAGNAHLLVAPTIEAGNILGKAFRYLANRPLSHVIEGAGVPILIPSRTESSRDKFYSIALGAVCSRR